MELRVEVEAPAGAGPAALRAWINDAPCGGPGMEPYAEGRVMLRFPAMIGAMRGDGEDRIRLATDGNPAKVFQVEVHICPDGGVRQADAAGVQR
jgi:hypothetical protein